MIYFLLIVGTIASAGLLTNAIVTKWFREVYGDNTLVKSTLHTHCSCCEEGHLLDPIQGIAFTTAILIASLVGMTFFIEPAVEMLDGNYASWNLVSLALCIGCVLILQKSHNSREQLMRDYLPELEPIR